MVQRHTQNAGVDEQMLTSAGAGGCEPPSERRRVPKEPPRPIQQGPLAAVLRFLRESQVPGVLSAPVIYSLVIPLVLLDLWVTLYQVFCFPLLGMSSVPRGTYFVFDRHRLAYLSAREKAHCAYCSYANGVLAYVREVAARTEKYWCPIKHAQPLADPHRHYHDFVGYGDSTGYRQALDQIRATLKEIPGPEPTGWSPSGPPRRKAV